MYPSENEILFSPNSKFKIMEVIENCKEFDGCLLIKCKVVAFDKKGEGFS